MVNSHLPDFRSSNVRVPFGEHREVAKALSSWKGKTVIDAMNALVPLEELDGLLSSAFVAKSFTGAKLVKGFNHLVAATLATDPVVEGGHSFGSAHLRGFVQEGAVIDHYVS